MFVNEGKVDLLNSLGSALASLEAGLYTNDVEITEETTLADLDEAAWAGYARQTVDAVGAAALTGIYARSAAEAYAIFDNESGDEQPFIGVFLVNPLTGALIATAQVNEDPIPPGLSFSFIPAFLMGEETP